MFVLGIVVESKRQRNATVEMFSGLFQVYHHEDLNKNQKPLWIRVVWFFL